MSTKNRLGRNPFEKTAKKSPEATPLNPRALVRTKIKTAAQPMVKAVAHPRSLGHGLLIDLPAEWFLFRVKAWALIAAQLLSNHK